MHSPQNVRRLVIVLCLRAGVGGGARGAGCSALDTARGQFWSLEGDEVYPALATLHRNNRWHLLFPHDKA
jgi:hypothetical protein